MGYEVAAEQPTGLRSLLCFNFEVLEDDMINKDIVSLPHAHTIPGLVFRPYHGTYDLSAMVAVREGSSVHDQIDPQSAREGIPTVEDLAPGVIDMNPPGTPDLLLAEVDGQVVGYNDVGNRWTEVTGTRVYLHLGYLLPAWRGRGIGSALLHWAQERIRAIAAEERPAGPAVFATNVSTTEREAGMLMVNAGYTEVRRLTDMKLELRHAIPSAPLPAGIAVTALAPAHYRAIYAAFKDAFSDFWTTIPESEEDYHDFCAENLSIPEGDVALQQIAWAGDTVVGFVLAHIRKGVGVIPQVAVRTTFQRRGIASSLLARALTGLQERGLTQARLYTDAADAHGARTLYERAGFREVKQHIFYRKPL
jgi:ribosomal protein S18 acetylase RimI-like enzyme